MLVSNFPLEPPKPGLRRLHLSATPVFQAPTEQLAKLWRPSGFSSPKSQGTFYNPPQNSMVRAVVTIPHSCYRFLCWSGFLSMKLKRLGEERLQLAYTSTSKSITEGSQGSNPNGAGPWRQERMQRPWRSAAHWLVMASSACCLIKLGQHPRVGSLSPVVKKRVTAGKWWRTPLILARRRQTQAEL